MDKQQELVANERLLRRMEQSRVDRYAALIQSISFQIAKDNGYDSPEDAHAEAMDLAVSTHLINELQQRYPGVSVDDLIIGGLEELLAQNRGR